MSRMNSNSKLGASSTLKLSRNSPLNARDDNSARLFRSEWSIVESTSSISLRFASSTKEGAMWIAYSDCIEDALEFATSKCYNNDISPPTDGGARKEGLSIG